MDVSVVQISAEKPASWLQLYITFILVAAIVIVGTGTLRLEVNKYIALLHKSIGDLELTNKQLKQEIDLKNAYEEELLVSSKKFQGLFDGKPGWGIATGWKWRSNRSKPGIWTSPDIPLSN